MTYDDIVYQVKKLRKNLTDNILRLSDDEIAPPRGSDIVVSDDYVAPVEIVTNVRFQYIWIL